MSDERASDADIYRRAFGAVLEGVTFYEFAHAVSADTRVKVAFEDLGRRLSAQLARLEAGAEPAAKDAPLYPGIYPLEAVSKAECYVCGHVVETRNLPSQCPQCGTARYTFEKEIALTKAWETASEASRKSADLFRDLAAKASAGARPLLEELEREDRALAAEAGKELAELRS